MQNRTPSNDPSNTPLAGGAFFTPDVEPFEYEPDIVAGIFSYDVVYYGEGSDEYNKSLAVLLDLAKQRGRECISVVFESFISDYGNPERRSDPDIDPAMTQKDFQKALALFETALLMQMEVA